MNAAKHPGDVMALFPMDKRAYVRKSFQLVDFILKFCRCSGVGMVYLSGVFRSCDTVNRVERQSLLKMTSRIHP